jgi:NAD(P)-dependent dehydrogenase (short-subunit alcohol dehydrogenase family)
MRQLETNMISPLVVIQAFAPLLGTDKKRQGPVGRIVNISSSGARVPIPLIGAYSSSKCGLEGMADALRIELMLFGIDVVIIEPGTVNTAMYDKGEKEDLSEFKPTAYWEAVQKFRKWIVTEARTNGLPPERLGEAVHVALSTANRRRVTRSFRSDSRTGLCPDFSLRGCLTPIWRHGVFRIT